MPNNLISFPYIGEYNDIVSNLIKYLTNYKIIKPNNLDEDNNILVNLYCIKQAKYQFKSNLGDYIYSLRNGANLLINFGYSTNYELYNELQEEILRSLGYKFTILNITNNNSFKIIRIYKYLKKINNKLNIIKYINIIIKVLLSVVLIDKINKYKREKYAIIKEKNQFNYIEQEKTKLFKFESNSIYSIVNTYQKIKKNYKKMSLVNNRDIKKILIIGDLYSLIASREINKIISLLFEKENIIYLENNLSNLLIKDRIFHKYYLNNIKKYQKYNLIGNGIESIYNTIKYCKKGIDGIIFLKSDGCIPELSIIPTINNISKDNNISVLYLNINDNNLVPKLEKFVNNIKDIFK